MRCLAVLLVLLLGGCAGSGVSADSTSGAFPARTAQDWVTYGDFFIELEAVSEQTLPPDENERFAGEGMFRRDFGRLPLSDGTLGRRVEGRRDSGSQPIYRALEGRTPAEAAELLRRTRPDPDVVPFLHENPQDRYQHGAGAKRSRGTPTPRER